MSKQDKNIADKGEIVLFKAGKGKSNIQVRFAGETLWLSLNQIADLFEK